MLARPRRDRATHRRAAAAADADASRRAGDLDACGRGDTDLSDPAGHLHRCGDDRRGRAAFDLPAGDLGGAASRASAGGCGSTRSAGSTSPPTRSGLRDARILVALRGPRRAGHQRRPWRPDLRRATVRPAGAGQCFGAVPLAEGGASRSTACSRIGRIGAASGRLRYLRLRRRAAARRLARGGGRWSSVSTISSTAARAAEPEAGAALARPGRTRARRSRHGRPGRARPLAAPQGSRSTPYARPRQLSTPSPSAAGRRLSPNTAARSAGRFRCSARRGCPAPARPMSMAR